MGIGKFASTLPATRGSRRTYIRRYAVSCLAFGMSGFSAGVLTCEALGMSPKLIIMGATSFAGLSCLVIFGFYLFAPEASAADAGEAEREDGTDDGGVPPEGVEYASHRVMQPFEHPNAHPRPMGPAEVIEAITQMQRQETLFVMERLRALQNREVARLDLTEQEKKVAAHLLLEDSNAAIARKLYLSEATVKAHVSSILAKTGAKSRQEFNRMIRHRLENPA